MHKSGEGDEGGGKKMKEWNIKEVRICLQKCNKKNEAKTKVVKITSQCHRRRLHAFISRGKINLDGSQCLQSRSNAQIFFSSPSPLSRRQKKKKIYKRSVLYRPFFFSSFCFHFSAPQCFISSYPFTLPFGLGIGFLLLNGNTNKQRIF